jgi:uncharacterized Zn finger protein
MGWGYWGEFAPRVTKAEQMRRAEKAKAALLKKKGATIEPVVVTGRKIAQSWWGMAWNQNLERYADYDNRLPRGRSYVRNGSVLDLKITATTIAGIVAGSHPQPYEVAINIKPLSKPVEQALMAKSRAALDSMSALLAGEFPAELKETFLEKGTGLFPSPAEITFKCSCPDWASMCKHVAATLYGTSVRLDSKPALFFALRGIKMDDFVGRMVKRESEKMLRKATAKSARVITTGEGDLSKLFGIAVDGAPAVTKRPPAAVARPVKKAGRPPAKKQTKKSRRKRPMKTQAP